MVFGTSLDLLVKKYPLIGNIRPLLFFHLDCGLKLFGEDYLSTLLFMRNEVMA